MNYLLQIQIDLFIYIYTIINLKRYMLIMEISKFLDEWDTNNNYYLLNLQKLINNI